MKMMDRDKKVVNTEEQNRTVNPSDSPVQEEPVSEDAAHAIEKSGNDDSKKEETQRGK